MVTLVWQACKNVAFVASMAVELTSNNCKSKGKNGHDLKWSAERGHGAAERRKGERQQFGERPKLSSCRFPSLRSSVSPSKHRALTHPLQQKRENLPESSKGGANRQHVQPHRSSGLLPSRAQVITSTVRRDVKMQIRATERGAS